MAGSGRCGFHCLSYCLTGDAMKYSDVIEDSITVFRNIPELFRITTNFASRGKSATLDNYEKLMTDAQNHVQFGFSFIRMHGMQTASLRRYHFCMI